jgi:NADPH:quinone reductase-like Zn-dependent oxidoreductase
VTRVGAEVSRVAVGDRVALLASRTGCFATHARTVDAAVVRLPNAVSLEEAAGVPVIACTAYYSLVHLGRLTKGESVLIHAAAGGIGQAAIILTHHLGAEIFATVSTPEKKAVLMDTYGIPEDHVLYSRDLSFGTDIMRLTKNRGVDVVPNSLAGETLHVSWGCVAPFARFTEIGKRDIYSNRRLEMFPFSKNIAFSSCDLETVMKLDQPLMRSLLQEAMMLWEQGVFRKTTPLNLFPYSEIESSFRLLQPGRHIGKVVLTAGKGDAVPVRNTSAVELLLPT